MKKKLLLNADVGEGMPNDSQLMPYLAYANIACGGHTGDEKSICKTIQLAKKNNVAIGAHPSYPDKINFGRYSLAISQSELAVSLQQQVDFFQHIAREAGQQMHHIKLHGALYNDVFASKAKTNWFLDWATTNYPTTKVFVPLNASTEIKMYKQCIIEAFADRNYHADLSLVARSEPNAILTSVSAIEKHVQGLVTGRLTPINGNEVAVSASTLCIHGDHPKALEIAKALYHMC